jgi:hypothetical protein
MANLKVFKQELLKGNLGNAFKSLSGSQTIEPYAYRNGMFFFGTGGNTSFFTYSGVESSLKAYTQCPELQSIINRRASAHCNGKRWIMKTTYKGKGKEDKSEYANKCRKLLNKPNPFQSGQQFETQLKIYIDVFGWCVILPIYSSPIIAKRGLSEASSLFLIPPYMLTWRETMYWKNQRNLKDVLSELTLTVGGSQSPLDLEQIVIIKDVVPRMYTGTIDGTGGMAELLLFPESKVRAQEKPINNIIAAYESRGELINYAGSQGIVSPNPGTGQYVPMSMTSEEETDLQSKFRMQYGITAKQYRYIISQNPLQFQAMGRPTKDLMLFEEIDADVRALCNAWYYPWKLLADSGSSLNGTEVDALTRNLYQDAIIPESCSIEQQLAEAFKAEENGTEWQRDYNHVPAMQDDQKAAADTRKVLGEAVINEFEKNMITYNRALELMGEDTVPDGDKYYYEWLKTHSTNTIQDGTTTSTAQTESGQTDTGGN